MIYETSLPRALRAGQACFLRPLSGLLGRCGGGIRRLCGSGVTTGERSGELRCSGIGSHLLKTFEDCVVTLLSRRDESCSQDAEGEDYNRQSPSGFLKEVSCLAHAECLVAGCEVGGKSATLGVLNQYYEEVSRRLAIIIKIKIAMNITFTTNVSLYRF